MRKVRVVRGFNTKCISSFFYHNMHKIFFEITRAPPAHPK